MSEEPGVYWDSNADVWKETHGGGHGPQGAHINECIVEEYIDGVLTRITALKSELAALTATELEQRNVIDGAEDRVIALEAENADLRALLKSHEEVQVSHDQTVRMIDMAISGSEGAARQASLVDLLSPIRAMRAQLTARTAEVEGLRVASLDVGKWLSASLDDDGVCAEMKSDVNAWFGALPVEWLDKATDAARAGEGTG